MQNIFVFGMGRLYKEKQEYIKQHFSIVGFLDNKASDNNGMHENTDIPVYNPMKIKKLLREDVKIALMSYCYPAMWKQLRGLGVKRESILFGITFPPLAEAQMALFGAGNCLTAEEDGAVSICCKGKKMIVEDHKQVQEIARELWRETCRKDYPLISAIAQMETKPASRGFGLERGTAIDRFYIEDFLEKNSSLVYGDCLEIAENTYTLKYGGDKVEHSYILHVMGDGENAIKGDLATGEGIETEKYDCAVITQTLMFIYNIHDAASNIYRMLKKGGNALITVSGISQISRHDADLWGSFYSFHEDAMRALFEPVFGRENVKVHVYGNVKVAIAMLYGLCREDLQETDFEAEDPDYPVIISVVLKKQ